MAEICPDCAGSFPDPADLVYHLRKAHAGGDPKESLSINPESRRPGLVCALCGRRFPTPGALARHALSPHDRWVRPTSGTRPTT